MIGEAQGHLARAEALLQALSPAPYAVHAAALQACYRAVHAVTGLAGFCALERVRLLALEVERVLEGMRIQRLDSSPARIAAMRAAIARIASVLGGKLQDGGQAEVDAAIIGALHAWAKADGRAEPAICRALPPAIARMLAIGSQITTGPPAPPSSPLQASHAR